MLHTVLEDETQPDTDRGVLARVAPSPCIVAVIPAYNEARYIGSVVLKTKEFADPVIVVDDGSNDQTADLARRAGAYVISHTQNAGKGMALNTGFQKAREFAPDAIVVLDADWQHCPEELPLVVDPVIKGEADLVIGSRYLARTSDVPLQRVVGHMGFNTLLNLASGTSVTDSQSGFRAFSSKAAQTITFGAKGFSVEAEMQFLAKDLHLRVKEVPITIRYHDKPKRSVIQHGLKVLNGTLTLIGQTRPFLFFSIPGLLILLVGLIEGFYVFEIYNRTQELAIGTALLAVLFCVVGVLALFTGIILHSLRGLIMQMRK